MTDKHIIHIAVAEPADMVRAGLGVFLSHIADLRVSFTEVDSLEALHDLMHSRTPHLVLVNPTFGGYFNLPDFRKSYPDSPTKFWAFLTTVVDPQLLAGYDSTLSFYETAESLTSKLNEAFRVEEEDSMEDVESLSSREKEVLVGVVQGMTNKEIAERLFLSVHTVITHRRNITRKLQIHSTSGLTIYALANKLIGAEDIV